MDNKIIIIASLKLVDNKLGELTKVIQELQDHCVKTEQGMLQYDWYKSESNDTIKVLETYKDSESVLFHFDNYKSFATQLSELRTFVSLEAYGPSSAALRQRVKKINAEHFMLISSLKKLS